MVRTCQQHRSHLKSQFLFLNHDMEVYEMRFSFSYYLRVLKRNTRQTNRNNEQLFRNDQQI